MVHFNCPRIRSESFWLSCVGFRSYPWFSKIPTVHRVKRIFKLHYSYEYIHPPFNCTFSSSSSEAYLLISQLVVNSLSMSIITFLKTLHGTESDVLVIPRQLPHPIKSPFFDILAICYFRVFGTSSYSQNVPNKLRSLCCRHVCFH